MYVTILLYIYATPELVMGHFFKTQPKISGPNPQKKSSPDPTQPIIDSWLNGMAY